MKIRIPFLEWFQGNGSSPAPNRTLLLQVGANDSIFMEHFKVFRSKLEYKADVLGWKVIGFTSSIAGEGKTLSCVQVGASLASTKRKNVLLVDADIRKADLSRGMRHPLHPGLTEFLLGHATLKDVVRGSVVQGLDIVSAGTSVSNPSDLLAGERFGVFIEEVRKSHDIVLLDTPPVLPVADTMAIRERLDGFVFLYRAGFTPLSMFQQAVEEIGEKKILGVLLNGVEPKSVKHYSYYYGHYYSESEKKDKVAHD